MTDRELMRQVARAWDEGYRQGVEDECISAANIGIAGFGAKVKPARQNPYGITPPQRKPEQEPNYWLGYGLQAHTEKPFEGATPLYTAPPQRTWVDLTDEEIMEPWPFENRVAFARWLGAKLKEKNA